MQIFEVFNADEEEVWKEKRRTFKTFEQAVHLFREGGSEEARLLFRNCRTGAPEGIRDGAIEYYLNRRD